MPISSPNVAKFPAMTVALLGDSITDNNGTASLVWNNIGFWTVANVMLRHRFTLTLVEGHAGARADQIIPYVPNIIAAQPGYCCVLAGTNDVGQSYTAVQITDSLRTMYQMLNAAGIVVVALTIPARGESAGVSLSSAKKTVLATVNDWIRRYCAAKPGMILADLWKTPATDQYSGDPTTGYFVDHVHPNALGAGALGKAVHDALNPINPAQDILSYTGGTATNGDPANRFYNPMFKDTTGTKTGGCTGSVADGWTLNGTSAVVGSKVVRTDGGEWQQVVVTAGATDFTLSQAVGIASAGNPGAVGDTMFGMIEVGADNDWVNVADMILKVQISGGGGPSVQNIIQGDAVNQPNYPALCGHNVVIRTPNIVIPSGATLVTFSLSVHRRSATNMTGTFRLSRPSLRSAGIAL